jgi:pimeloyl-ACP methyl ester carboxylesterase
MHTALSIRDRNGQSVTADAVSLARTFPTATGRVAVLLHGLGKTEHCWTPQADGVDMDLGLPGHLEKDGFTPVLVRYNTGERVSDNGARLAVLLGDVAEHWPVPVEEFVLIGHSMGGLVERSSLHHGRIAGQTWVDLTRHVVAIGTPHSGSPLAKGADIASRMLGRACVTRPIGMFVDDRSEGIKDMSSGISTRVNHHGHSSPAGMPLFRRIRVHHIAGVVTANTSHPLGSLVGDLVVRAESAMGVEVTGEFGATDIRVFGGQNHLGLLSDPDVHCQISSWLAPPASALHLDSS